MYYELLSTLAQNYAHDFAKIIKYLISKDLNKLIEAYYQENKELLIKKLNPKEEKKIKNRILRIFNS